MKLGRQLRHLWIVEDYLPNTHKALGSNLSSVKKETCLQMPTSLVSHLKKNFSMDSLSYRVGLDFAARHLNDIPSPSSSSLKWLGHQRGTDVLTVSVLVVLFQSYFPVCHFSLCFLRIYLFIQDIYSKSHILSSMVDTQLYSHLLWIFSTIAPLCNNFYGAVISYVIKVWL